MGHARVTLEEVDVNGVVGRGGGGGGDASPPGDASAPDGRAARYLDHTKSPTGIIRIVIDMLENWKRNWTGGPATSEA